MDGGCRRKVDESESGGRDGSRESLPLIGGLRVFIERRSVARSAALAADRSVVAGPRSAVAAQLTPLPAMLRRQPSTAIQLGHPPDVRRSSHDAGVPGVPLAHAHKEKYPTIRTPEHSVGYIK